MTFQDLNLNKALHNALDNLGFEQPTPIQEQVFSVVMSGKDICAIAQTGTGKTYAYLLPCLRLYEYSAIKNPQLLIIVPTRELVVQVIEALEKLAAYLSLKAVGLYGGANIKTQMAQIQQGADVLVATPGRLLDLINNGSIKTKAIKRVVIDEFDEMLNLGFRTQLNNIFEKLPARRQNILFSATINPEMDELITKFFQDSIKIEVHSSGTPLQGIEQYYYSVPNFYTKVNLLIMLLKTDASMTKVLVFMDNKKQADLVFGLLESHFAHEMDIIHSNKAQNHRFNTVNEFQKGNYRILLATDILARGLDIIDISHVINFDLPEVPENYMHRIGRTGRAQKSGTAISFVTEQEKPLQDAIETLMRYDIPKLPLPKDLEISTLLLVSEQPKILMKTELIKPKKMMDKGAAFHEKSEKNSKVNVRRDHEKEKQLKYGKAYRKRSKN